MPGSASKENMTFLLIEDWLNSKNVDSCVGGRLFSFFCQVTKGNGSNLSEVGLSHY